MATELERLTVSLDADLKKFEKAMAKASAMTVKQLRSIEKGAAASTKKIESSYAGLGGRIGNIGALMQGALQAFSVERLVTGMRDVVKGIADIGDAADKLGLTTDEMQQMRFVAKLAGVDAEAFANGMKKLELNTSGASRGQGDFGKILTANAVSIRNQNGELLSQAEVLGIVADLVRNAANEQDQAEIARAALGKSGVELLNLLREGSAGVSDAMKKAAESGVSFSENQIREAQKIDDRFDELIETVSVSFKKEVLNTVQQTVKEWDRISEAILISKAYLESWIGSLGGAVQLSNQLAQVVSGGKVDREIGMTPANQDGKGSLPANIDDRTFGMIKPTVIPGPATSASKAISDAERAQKAIDNVVTALKFEGEQLRVNALQQEINNRLREAGISATSAQGQEIARLVTANYNLEASQRLVAEATSNYAERLEEVKNAQMEVARMGVDAFNRIAIGGEKVTDVLIGLVDQLAQAAVNGALLGDGPLGTLFGSAGSGGLIGSLLGGGSSFAGFYAKGGQIPSGKFGITGEAGPELIKGPATVVPMNRNGGGTRTSVTIVQNIQANGDKTVADIAFRETSRALRDYERQRPSIDIERRLRTA